MKIILFFLVFFSTTLSAQDFSDVPGKNAVYFEDIKSIEFRIGKKGANSLGNWADISKLQAQIDSLNKLLFVFKGAQTTAIEDQIKNLQRKTDKTYKKATDRDSWTSIFTSSFSPIPIYTLNSKETIQFAFDDLHPESVGYSYTVIPYKWDWSQPQDLLESEYLSGFTTSRIDQFFYAEITTVDYTSYRFSFPNAEIEPIISGNFLLIVYGTNSEEVAFTRRVHISEQSFFFEADIRNVDFDRDSLQFLNFTISYPQDFSHLAPARDIKVVVLQNGRYDNAIIKEKPTHVIKNKLRYGYQDKIGFQPGKSFRNIQIQTLDYPQVGVETVHKSNESNEVYLDLQEERVYHPNFFYRDINGQFVTMNGVNDEELGDPDYAHVYFIYNHHEPYYQAELYVIGKFTDWQFKEEFRLSFNERNKRYEGEAFLKQGFYDYYFALKHKDKDQINIDKTEGHAYETNNDYTILVYYTTPNGRFDKLMLLKTISVNNR